MFLFERKVSNKSTVDEYNKELQIMGEVRKTLDRAGVAKS